MSEQDAKASEIDRINSKIIALADSAIASGKPYLLSTLGLDLGADLELLKETTKQSLTEFIQKRLGDRFSVVNVGTHGNIRALISAGQASQTEEDEVVAPLSGSMNQASKPRYNYRFWAAFAVPDKGKKRWIDKETSMFRDEEIDADPPDDHMEIPAEFLLSADVDNRDVAISNNICRWLEINKLDPKGFYARSTRVRSPSSENIILEKKSVLEMVIDSLDRKQLSSISLPLDVVDSLLRARR